MDASAAKSKRQSNLIREQVRSSFPALSAKFSAIVAHSLWRLVTAMLVLPLLVLAPTEEPSVRFFHSLSLPFSFEEQRNLISGWVSGRFPFGSRHAEPQAVGLFSPSRSEPPSVRQVQAPLTPSLATCRAERLGGWGA